MTLTQMLNKTTLKILLRSRSLNFTRDCGAKSKENGVAAYTWKGKDIFYRPGTSDTELIYKILLYPPRRSEYRICADLDPKVIFDIGGNIGTAAIYFADLYPKAEIFTFEPIPENYALLEKNTREYKNIKPACMALGAHSGKLAMSASYAAGNMGGYSFYSLGVDENNKVDVDVRTASSVMKELGLDRVDIIKVDTEGAEYDIITSFDRDVLRRVEWITGELHGIKDFALLAYLSEWFDISTRKNFGKRLFNFSACNREIINKIRY